MKKLNLDLTELRVESFETAGDGRTPRGTVRGNAASDCCTFSCAGTCGIIPDSTETAAIAPTRRCETNDMTGCQPCCV